MVEHGFLALPGTSCSSVQWQSVQQIFCLGKGWSALGNDHAVTDAEHRFHTQAHAWYLALADKVSLHRSVHAYTHTCSCARMYAYLNAPMRRHTNHPQSRYWSISRPVPHLQGWRQGEGWLTLMPHSHRHAEGVHQGFASNTTSGVQDLKRLRVHLIYKVQVLWTS